MGASNHCSQRGQSRSGRGQRQEEWAKSRACKGGAKAHLEPCRKEWEDVVRHDRLNHAAVGSALTTGCAALTVEWRNCVTLYGIAYGIRSVRGCQSGNPTHVHCDLHRTYQLLVTATRNGYS